MAAKVSRKFRLQAACEHRKMTMVKLCKELKIGKSGLYKALDSNADSYSHYQKISAHLKIPMEWLVYGKAELEPKWMNQRESPGDTQASKSTKSVERPKRRSRTTMDDDEVATRLEILERRYAVVADRFLSLAERAQNDGVFVSPREIDEIKDDLDNLTGK